MLIIVKNIKEGVRNLRFLITLVPRRHVTATCLIIMAICLLLEQLALYNYHLPLFPTILASYIYILNYLLGRLFSRANLLALLFLFLRVLLLYFPLLLGLFRALKYLPPIILIMLRLGFLLFGLAFIPLTPIYLSSTGPTSIIL